MKKNFATVFVVALVLSIMFSSLPLAPVQAQSGGGTGGGTFTLNVTAAMGAGSGYDRFTYVRDPNAQELSQIKFDIFFWPAPVGTAGVVVHSGVGTGSYVLRTLGPNERYSIDVKQPPEGGDYATNLWFGNFIWGIGSTNGQPPQPLPNGSTQNIQLKFRYNFNSLETLGGGYAQIPTVFKGEIVDYKGSLVRSLTADEKAQTSFEVVSFNGVTNVDVPAGVIIAGGKLSPPANKLETTYMLGVEKKSAAGCVRCYRVINITPPSGYVLRYIRSITSGQGLGMGGDFAPPWLLSQEVRNEYKDFLSPSDLQVPTMEFMLSFAPAFGSSLAKVQDRMVYVPGGDSGLALVQRFINTYGKWQGNDPATDLTPGYLEFHSDGRWAKNAVEPVKPFPRGAKAAYFGGKAYLFINAGQQLMVYDISNPTSPTLKRTINVKDILAAGGRPVTSADLQDFTTVNNAPPTFADVVVLDNSPYILVSVGWQGEVNGVAALKVDSASASLTATSDLVYLGKGYSTTGLFGYKGGGGKY